MNQITKLEVLTKAQQDQVAASIAENLLDNNNPLEAFIKLKAFEEVFKKVKSQIDEEAMKEADKYGKGQHVLNGVAFQVKNGRAVYDFSDDEEHAKLKQDLKDRETFLKSIKSPMVDPETGVLASPAKVKHAKDSISITFPKQ